jgi:hypothetical protein
LRERGREGERERGREGEKKRRREEEKKRRRDWAIGDLSCVWNPENPSNLCPKFTAKAQREKRHQSFSEILKILAIRVLIF